MEPPALAISRSDDPFRSRQDGEVLRADEIADEPDLSRRLAGCRADDGIIGLRPSGLLSGSRSGLGRTAAEREQCGETKQGQCWNSHDVPPRQRDPIHAVPFSRLEPHSYKLVEHARD